MSDKPKHPYAKAVQVAKEIVDILKPFTLETPEAMKAEWPHPNLLVVAGSLRRRKPEVGDIEIVYVTRQAERKADFFATESVNLVDEVTSQMLKDGRLAKRPSVTGVFTWGPLNKLGIHVASGIPIDLFATSLENWWVSLVIRTGSKESNLRLTTGANNQDATLNAYGSGITWSDGTRTDAVSERHVFELCKVPYLDPWKR